MNIKNAVICAAGLGSRLGLDMPKCMVKIGSHRLIYYLLQALEHVEHVRMVVGFKEEEVIDYVRRIRPDVVFVRNPDYRTTTNAYSLYLGSHDLQEPFLNIDGDMFITRAELERFDGLAASAGELIGIMKSYTEDAVFVGLDAEKKVSAFSRERISEYEWTGIAYLRPGRIRRDGRYVYQELERALPVAACEIECYEIDTPRDLEYVQDKITHLL
jgi:choline kinase